MTEKMLTVMLIDSTNILLKFFNISYSRFTSCHDLVLSRFCSADYREHGIVGIKVRRIIRVHNRILRSRFDEKLLSIVDDADGEYYATSRSVLSLCHIYMAS